MRGGVGRIEAAGGRGEMLAWGFVWMVDRGMGERIGEGMGGGIWKYGRGIGIWCRCGYITHRQRDLPLPGRGRSVSAPW